MGTSTAATIYSQISGFASFGANLLIIGLGVVGAFKLLTGGFGFIKVTSKLLKFIDRVDVLVDDFWPEVLSGLEARKFISTGSTARWTSAQAKVLKAKSPIQITPAGDKILADIGFSDVYLKNAGKIVGYVKTKLANRKNITDLDIEQASLEVGVELFEKEDSLVQCAKEYLFQHPAVPVSQLKVLIGIFIRDKMLINDSVRALGKK